MDGSDPHHASTQDLLEASGEEVLGASAITLAETVVSPARASQLADAEEALQRLGVTELSLGEHALGRLAQLRVEVGMRLPDCCVLLAAQEHAATVASFDSDLLTAAGKLGLKTTEGSPERDSNS